MTASLILLLWSCSGVAALACFTFWRDDYTGIYLCNRIKLVPAVVAMAAGPLSFIFAAPPVLFEFVTQALSRMNPVIWSRK